MVICKFFLQGSCRYGANCKFEHSYNSKYSYHAPKNNPVPAQPQAAGVTDEQLINQVRADIQSALKGGQWILSSYTPFKEKALMPGFTELSPEEARLFIYEAKASNNLDEAVAYMNNLFKEAQQKYEQLLQPTPAITNVLRSLYKGEPVISPFIQSSFGSSNNAASSVFRNAVQNPPVYGQNQNINPGSIFAQANQDNPASVFGQANQASSIFGQASQSAFGLNQQSQNNAFGQTSPQNTAPSIFGHANLSSPNAASIFGQANQSLSPGPFFPQDKQTNAASVFAQANSAVSLEAAKSVFAQAVQNQNLIGASTSPFAQTVEPKSVFAQANQNIQQQNVFQTQQPNANQLGSFVSVPRPSDPFSLPSSSNAYSKLEELSERDLEAYSSIDFKLGFVPMLPPPQELCL